MEICFCLEIRFPRSFLRFPPASLQAGFRVSFSDRQSVPAFSFFYVFLDPCTVVQGLFFAHIIPLSVQEKPVLSRFLRRFHIGTKLVRMY